MKCPKCKFDLEHIIKEARKQERLYIHDIVGKMIKREHLLGDGLNKHAERNGVITVYNKIGSLD